MAKFYDRHGAATLPHRPRQPQHRLQSPRRRQPVSNAVTVPRQSKAPPGANMRHCATPATRAVHSHSTTAAAIAQTAAKIQPPSKAMATASGAKTEADAVRRRKFSVSGAAGFASLPGTGSRRFGIITSRSAQSVRRSVVRAGGIRQSHFRVPRGRNRANRSARRQARYKPPARAENWTGAVPHWCG